MNERTSNLDLHARRLEGRRLMQAVLDGEASSSTPRFRQLVESDPMLREEFQTYRELGSILRQMPGSPDVTANVLSALNSRPVFLPQQPRRSKFSPKSAVALAACLALSGAVLWLSFFELEPARSRTLRAALQRHTDVVGDAREVIRSTTGTNYASLSRPGALVISPASETGQIPDLEQLSRVATVDDADPRLTAAQMAADSKLLIGRAGLSVINPGPATSASGPRKAMVAWSSLPDAEYSGGRSRRSDSFRVAAVATGWYDREGAYVPLTGVGIPNPK